ncbi:reprolysin-like metallopeptidase [Psychromonas aquimarina]|uniref:reprolysin-like metallopeptidase n=1 Tax=Psychromonas aquimarina TaxID=444919 RepID=UPI0003FCD506|nr:zinc-dependent metalloprotease family protein [Psychromonas aquimarina]
MIKLTKKIFTPSASLLLLAVCSAGAFAADSTDWLPLSSNLIENSTFDIAASKYRLYNLNKLQIEEKLNNKQPVRISLPLPDGGVSEYLLTASSVMEAGLADKYPGLKTYSGVNLSDPSETGSFTLTPAGFDAMFVHQGQTIFIDPLKGENEIYVVYNRKDALNSMPDLQDEVLDSQLSIKAKSAARTIVAGAGIRELRIAFSTSSTYSALFGSSKAEVVAELTRLVNRLNQVYEKDLAVRFILIADTDKTIFIDAAADPFKDNDYLDIDTNQATQASLIGLDKFDIGHLLNTSGSGLASLSSVCSFNKANGVSGVNRYGTTTGDAFFIDYVAHEIGHQMGAEHSFNGNLGACGNRSANSAWEPGSGSTIMSYVGICGEINLQSNADGYFHAGSIKQMQDNLASHSSCGTIAAQNNQAPAVSAGADYTIPANTAFKLTAAATDADGDELYYRWEQLDIGTTPEGSALELTKDNGDRSLFRSYPASLLSERYFPSLTGVLSGSLVTGEAWPAAERTMTFNVTALDNRGGVAMDEMALTVIKQSEAFSVTTPAELWKGGYEYSVLWNTAGTKDAPVSCSSVDILMAADGQNFNLKLAAAVDNSGSALITAPQVNSNQAKLMLACADNVFYALSQDSFSVTESAAPVIPVIESQTQPIEINTDGNYKITLADFVFSAGQDSSAFTFAVLAGDNYSVVGNTIVPNADFSGQLTVSVIVSNASKSSLPFALTVNVLKKPEPVLPVIESQTKKIEISNDNSYTVTLADFNFSSEQDSQNFTIEVLAGDDYSLAGNKVVPDTGFNGRLTVPVIVTNSSKSAVPFELQIDVVKTAVVTAEAGTESETIKENVSTAVTSTPVSSEGGGSSLGWQLLLLLSLISFRKNKRV